MIKFLFLTFTLVLSACAIGPSLSEQHISAARTMAIETSVYYQKHGKTATINAGKDAVKRTLKDPSSAEFTNLRIGAFEGGKLVCGNVNAKNSYGGYVGVKPFAASPSAAVIYTDYDYAFITEFANVSIIQGCLK